MDLVCLTNAALTLVAAGLRYLLVVGHENM